eukprot:377339-Hanusia_phi.AAC.1
MESVRKEVTEATITVHLENNETAQELWRGCKTVRLDEDTILKAWPEDNESIISTAAYMKPCKGEESQAMENSRILSMAGRGLRQWKYRRYARKYDVVTLP